MDALLSALATSRGSRKNACCGQPWNEIADRPAPPGVANGFASGSDRMSTQMADRLGVGRSGQPRPCVVWSGGCRDGGKHARALRVGLRCERTCKMVNGGSSGRSRPSPIAVPLPGRHAGVVRTDPPDEDAYGRVTDPERFQAVADAAAGLVSELVGNFDVEAMVGSTAVDFPDWPDGSIETIRLVPAVGTPLAIMITDFPGVFIRFGAWGREAFPACGCDACDEQPPDVIETMHRLIEAAVAGRYEEELTERTLSYSFSGAWGGESSEGRLKRGEWRHHGEPGTHSWPPWPRRKRS